MTAIAIFVKTPGLSPIKTRLAASIGQSKAETWHTMAAHAVAELALAANIGPVYFAVAETQARNHPLWRNVDCLIQPSGGLGERMASIHRALVEDHQSALLLGADGPHIDPTGLEQAQQWLMRDNPSLVIGPATDGGFWIFGANRIIDTPVMAGVTYSQDNTRQQFQQALESIGQWLTLDTYTDVDTFEDLKNVHQIMRHKKSLLPKQQALVHWVEETLF